MVFILKLYPVESGLTPFKELTGDDLQVIMGCNLFFLNIFAARIKVRKMQIFSGIM